MHAFRGPALAGVFCTALAASALASAPDANDPGLGAAPGERQQKGDAEAVAMKALLQHVKEVVNAARKPEDLDPLLFDLQKYQNNGFDGFVAPGNQELVQQILAALEFTRRWQDYLSHLASGQTEQARNDLASLSQNNYAPGIVPRSHILALLTGRPAPVQVESSAARTPQVADAQKIIDSINKLDDLNPALKQLNELAADDEFARECAQHLAPMVEVYGDLKSGLPTSVSLDFMGGVTGAGVSVRANSLLLKFILQHYFDTYKGAPPADNETPAAYAGRVKTDALSGQDWALLKKALTVHSCLYRNVAGADSAPDDESAGLNDMITGINQQEAGQFSLAVESFQDALKAGSMDIPAKSIGERLDAIKRDHPGEYDAGMESFLSPPRPQYYPGMNPSMYNPMYGDPRLRAGPPGYPANLPKQQTSTISIPAAKPASTYAPTTAK